MVSDERFKNVRSTVVSDERFKELGEISDIRLKALEKLSSFTELSDEDMKTVIFKELPKEEAFKDDLKPHAIKVSAEEMKNIEVPTEESGDVDKAQLIAAVTKLAEGDAIKPEPSDFDFSRLVKEPGIGEPELGEFDLKEIGRTLASLTPRRSA